MENSKTTKEMIDKVNEQYKLYAEAIKPIYPHLHGNGLITEKSNEILKKLFLDNIKEHSIKYNEISTGRYNINFNNCDLEVFISSGTMHITNTDYHKKYYLQVSLDITNIYYSYNIMVFDFTDKFGEDVERLNLKARTGSLNDIQMLQFIQKMQSNLLKLNEEKNYLRTHNSYKDYEYELNDTVYTDDNGIPIQYENFDILLQELKNRIEK